MEEIRIGITGLGSCVPETRVSNDDLARHVNTSDKWIRERTGIIERRFSSEREPLPVLMSVAGQRALNDAGISAEDVDYIYSAENGTDEFVLPHGAARVQYLLGARKAAANNVGAGCTGAIYAIRDAQAQIYYDSIVKKKKSIALVLGGDTLSHVVNVKDDESKSSLVVLADGAGAAVIRAIEDADMGIRQVITRADGSMGHLIYLKSGFASPLVGANPVRLKNRGKRGYFKMEGDKVHRFVLESERSGDMIKELIEESGYKFYPDDETKPSRGLEVFAESVIVPHQINKRSLGSFKEKLVSRFGCEPKLVYRDSAEIHGNTSPASTLIGLDDLYRNKKLDIYDIVLVVAFGSGLTWGGFLTIWNRYKLKEIREWDADEQRELVQKFNERYDVWKAKLAK